MSPLFDAWLLDNSAPTQVKRVHNRETEYRERLEVRARAAVQMREWAERNRERLKAYKREYNQRSEVRERRLRYSRGYHQRPEVIEETRRRKNAVGGNRENWRTVSLDADYIEHSAGSTRAPTSIDFHEVIGTNATDPLQLVLEQGSEIAGVLGGLDEEDINRMSEDDLIRLREKLIAAGVTPTTQYEERAAEREIVAKAGSHRWRN